MKSLIEIEVDSNDPPNSNLFFYPAEKTIRGRFIHTREREPNAAMLGQRWGDGGIPGQRIVIDVEGREAAIVEPLHDEEFSGLAERIKERGMKLPDRRTSFKLATVDDVATWLHWMQRAVRDGNAKLVKGVFPEKLPGRAKTRFGSVPSNGDDDKINKLIGVIYALLPADKRAEVEALLAQ